MAEIEGGTVTALGADPRRGGTLRVAVDGRALGSVPQVAAEAAGILEGITLDAVTAELLRLLVEQEAAMRAGLACLSHRPFASADLARRLRRRGHAPLAVSGAIDGLRTMGLLDDAEFAEAYVRSKSERGRGPARLRHDLGAMGVAREVIDAALAARWPGGEVDEAMPLALARRRAAQLGALDHGTKRRRIVAYLARRGFTGHTSMKVVNQALDESAE